MEISAARSPPLRQMRPDGVDEGSEAGVPGADEGCAVGVSGFGSGMVRALGLRSSGRAQVQSVARGATALETATSNFRPLISSARPC